MMKIGIDGVMVLENYILICELVSWPSLPLSTIVKNDNSGIKIGMDGPIKYIID